MPFLFLHLALYFKLTEVCLITVFFFCSHTLPLPFQRLHHSLLSLHSTLYFVFPFFLLCGHSVSYIVFVHYFTLSLLLLHDVRMLIVLFRMYTVRLEHLPFNVTQKDLDEVLSPYGQILDIRLELRIKDGQELMSADVK